MDSRVDGRVARGERTRQAIVDAHTELLREGNLKPTARAVADRAGVSVRTLWTNFDDLESLFRETVKRWMQLDAAAWEPVDPTLLLDERIRQFCVRRTRRLENLAPAARSAVLSEPFSIELRASRAIHVERLLNDLEHTFGAELGPRADREDSAYHQLYLLASWSAWESMRSDLDMTPEATLSATIDGFRRILS